MEIFYFLAIYLAVYLLTNYMNKMVNADLFLIKKLKIKTKKKVALLGACTSAIIYIFLLLISQTFGWKVSTFVFSSVSVGITVGLIININKKLMKPTKRTKKQK